MNSGGPAEGGNQWLPGRSEPVPVTSVVQPAGLRTCSWRAERQVLTITRGLLEGAPEALGPACGTGPHPPVPSPCVSPSDQQNDAPPLLSPPGVTHGALQATHAEHGGISDGPRLAGLQSPGGCHDHQCHWVLAVPAPWEAGESQPTRSAPFALRWAKVQDLVPTRPVQRSPPVQEATERRACLTGRRWPARKGLSWRVLPCPFPLSALGLHLLEK